MPTQSRTTTIRDGQWDGDPVFILGGGPSLNHVGDITRINDVGCRVIVVNRSIELPVQADMWVWMDTHFYRWALDGELGPLMEMVADSYTGLRVTRRTNHYPATDDCECGACLAVRGLPDNVTTVRSQTGHELGPSIADGVRVGKSSGFFALNLAYCMGCDPIILVGYDCKDTNGDEEWWHEGYPRKHRNANYGSMRRNFEDAAVRLRDENRTAWNVSPLTGIAGFDVLDSIDVALRRLSIYRAAR